MTIIIIICIKYIMVVLWRRENVDKRMRICVVGGCVIENGPTICICDCVSCSLFALPAVVLSACVRACVRHDI